LINGVLIDRMKRNNNESKQFHKIGSLLIVFLALVLLLGLVTVTASAKKKVKLTDYEVVPSEYKSVKNYCWEDVYTILCLISPSNAEDPRFSVFRIHDCDSVFLYVEGTPSDEILHHYLYVYDDEKVYLLNDFENRLEYSETMNAFREVGPDTEWYFYAPHVLLKTEAASLNTVIDDFKELSLTEISGDMIITSETIGEWLLEPDEIASGHLSGGKTGGAE